MSGRSYKLPSGRYQWRGRIDGKPYKRSFDRKAQADAWGARLQADAQRGELIDQGNRVTVAEYARGWLEARVLRPNTRANDDVFLRGHLDPTPLGARPIVRVRPSEVQAWVTGRAQLLGPATVRSYTTRLRSVFAAAALDGVIARNPVLPDGRLSLPKVDRPKFEPLTVAQVQAWAAHAPPRLQAMILAQAGLGLRLSELRGLRVTDVDFLRREVRIEAQLDTAGRQRVPLKTANSRRVVPLPSVTAEVLAEHIRRYPPGPDGVIFTNSKRGAWALSRLPSTYRDAAAAAGLPAGTSSHALRHHCASVLLARGASVHQVAEWLGDTPAMVLNVYGHVMPDQRDTARLMIDAEWEAHRAGRAEGAR